MSPWETLPPELLRPNLPARLLQAATLAPQRLQELVARADPDGRHRLKSWRDALLNNTQDGHLCRSVPRRPVRYVLTAFGEDRLDELWQAALDAHRKALARTTQEAA